MNPLVISVEDVTKNFTVQKQKSLKERLVNSKVGKLHKETFTALNHVNLDVRSGESVGLVGPNGSGKSTLLKSIGGILSPDSGTIKVRGRIAALLELGAGFHPDLTGRENVYLNAAIQGLTRHETDQYYDAIVDFSGIPDFMDTQVKFYSSGMYVRLAFAVAIHVDPDILLVDEVLAVGDEPFQVKCMDKIRQFQVEGRTIVFVSHSAGQVADICDRAVVLEHGTIVDDDVPSVALRRLRQDYQTTINANRADDSTSDFSGKITDIRLTDSLGSPSFEYFELVMPPGSDLTVSCDIDLPTPVPKWSLHAKIENTLGALHIQTDSRENLELGCPEVSGTIHARLTFQHLDLGEGEYQIILSVHDEDRKVVATANSHFFAVRGYHRASGPVYAEPILTFEPPVG